MHNNEKISVILPVYNSSEFIIATLNSIINQTHRNIEIIIIDDCSTDNTNELIDSIKDDRIVKIIFKKNRGVAHARNEGLKLAKGRFVAFIDSDDIWINNKLEVQLHFMMKNNIAFSYTAIEIINEDGDLLKTKRRIIERVSYGRLLRNTVIATSSVMIDTKTTGLVQMPIIRSGQDYATWLYLLRTIKYAFGIDQVLTIYRKRSNSLSSSKTKNFKKLYRIQRDYENIGRLHAAFNILFYIINAVKKHYF